MAAKTATAKKKSQAAPAPEVEDEEIDEVETTETAEVTFGVSDLVELIKQKLGKDTTTRELRTLLRKMARDGRLDREIVAGNRARWEWSGPSDPEVKTVIAAFKAGELEADKQEKLQALKDRKAEKKAAAEKEAAKAAKTEKPKGKKAAAVVEEDEDELELDDEE